MTTITTAPAPVKLDIITVAPTCPGCDSHNVTTNDLGRCGDCGLTDNLSAFMGGGMTANARIAPSKFGKGGSARTFDRTTVRGWTISGRVD